MRFRVQRSNNNAGLKGAVANDVIFVARRIIETISFVGVQSTSHAPGPHVADLYALYKYALINVKERRDGHRGSQKAQNEFRISYFLSLAHSELPEDEGRPI